jgi:glutathione-regulated potassium-efflux system ancillary protein KefC/glutathione-regulated potassium-efflux system protein KefB
MLTQIIVLLLAAVILVPLCTRLALGGVIGYLLAGLLVGPGVFGLVDEVESVMHLSEFGVVFLLFVIGLELRPSRLWLLREQVFGHGSAQVLITGSLIGVAAWFTGLSWQASIVVGAGLALSSTALVLQTLAEKGQLTARHGREAFAILLFQDLAVIPLLAILPALGSVASDASQPGWQSALRATAILVAAVLGSRLLLRPLLRLIVTFGGREIFTASALLLVVGSALSTVWAGLSMSLGAFLAGVLLADSEYRHELEAVIEPFKGLLLGLFFMSVGMTVDLPLLFREPVIVIGLVLALIVVKTLVLVAMRPLLKTSVDSTRKLALALAQGGEFAFVLFGIAAGFGIFDKPTSAILTLVVAVSMLLSPLLFLFDEKVLDRLKPAEPVASDYDPIQDTGSPVIIVGFGRVGQVVARVLNSRSIPFTALEINPQQIDFVRKFGNKVYYGDASRLDLLEAAGIKNAKLFVLAIGNSEVSVKVAAMVRKHFPHVPIYARTRNRAHTYQLLDLGVKLQIRETLYSSMELSRGVLQELGFDRPEVDRTIEAFREFDYKLLHQQHAVHRDEQQLIATARQANEELKSLFEAERPTTEAQQKA